MVLYGSSYPVGKLGIDTIPPLLFTALRLGLIFLAFLPFFKLKLPEKHLLMPLLGFSFAMGIGTYVTMYYALEQLSIVAPIIIGAQLSIPFGLILTRAYGLGDIRKIGSGNIGATNVLRTGNKKIALMTLLLDGIKGAFLTTEDGYTDPTSTTNAMAKGARNGGAKIYRKNRVTDIKKTSSGEWKVITEKGDIICEHVVNAAGSFCPEVAAMVGLKNVPSINMVHQYLVTEAHPEIEKLDKELQKKGLAPNEYGKGRNV